MPLDLTVAGVPIPTSSDLTKDLLRDAATAFALGANLQNMLDSPLSTVPASASKATIGYASGTASWKPSGGPVEFTLQGGASGSLEIINSGTLITYTDGLDSPKQASIPVPPHASYVCVVLNFNISAGVAGTYSNGPYGVKAALNTKDSYQIKYCKRFDPSTPVRDAIAQSFQDFMLPLHGGTLQGMSEGDFLLYEFDGNLHLSFGAYVGLERIFYAGQLAADVKASANAPLMNFNIAAKPTMKAAASLDFSFQYATMFEALLSRPAGGANMHLFRSSKRDSSVTGSIGLTFDANVTASITPHLDELRTSITSSVPPGEQAALGKVVTTAATAIDDHVQEVNDRLGVWLKKMDGKKANLQVLIENIQSRTLLLAYRFDLQAANFSSAWNYAISGDFVEALKTGAVQLELGSGLEQAYQSKTTFSINFFNLWHWSLANAFFSNASLVYAKNNVFHLSANIGRETDTESIGYQRSLNMYFAASANVSESGAISDTDVDLHFVLNSQGDAKATAAMASLLSAIEAGPLCDALAKGLATFSNTAHRGAAQVEIILKPSAYALLNCDPYVNQKPASNQSYNDQANWKAFSSACEKLNAWFISPRSLPASDASIFATYGAWEIWNEAANNTAQWAADHPNDVHANRRRPGNWSSQWPVNFDPNLEDSTRQQVGYSLLAGQEFMNFCEDLTQLRDLTTVSPTPVQWTTLIHDLATAIKNDTSVDFIRPTALALVHLCNRSTIEAVGPAPGMAPTNHYSVQVTLH